MKPYVIPPKHARREPDLVAADIDALILRQVARQRRTDEAYLSAGLIFTPCEERLTNAPYRWAWQAWLADSGRYDADRDPGNGE